MKGTRDGVDRGRCGSEIGWPSGNDGAYRVPRPQGKEESTRPGQSGWLNISLNRRRRDPLQKNRVRYLFILGETVETYKEERLGMQVDGGKYGAAYNGENREDCFQHKRL